MTRQSRGLRFRGLSVVLIGVWACSGAGVGPSVVSSGTWGGDHISMSVADTGTHVELDCAYGDIPGAFRVDARNSFTVAGTFVLEHGGPSREGEASDAQRATYSGSVISNTMALTIRLTDTGQL